MEREVSEILQLGAGLAMLAAYIGIVVSTVFYGNSIKGMTLEKLDSMDIQLASSALGELRDSETEMSVASAYNLINSYGKVIGEVNCKLNEYHSDGKNTTFITSEGSGCVISHIKGRCKMTVVIDDSRSIYIVEIHKKECVNTYDNCTCGGD